MFHKGRGDYLHRIESCADDDELVSPPRCWSTRNAIRARRAGFTFYELQARDLTLSINGRYHGRGMLDVKWLYPEEWNGSVLDQEQRTGR